VKKGYKMTNAIDLTTYIQKVWAANGLEAKKNAMLELINASRAKVKTKQDYTMIVNAERNPKRLDTLASNYAMAGEGLKVR
jgi:hypothetical protein